MSTRLPFASLTQVSNRRLQDFQSLSMNAEKWLPMECVSHEQLPAYFKQQRQRGYYIVGAEQVWTQHLRLSYHPDARLRRISNHLTPGIY